ncbi:MAG: LolA family protein [Arachnia sp.]
MSSTTANRRSFFRSPWVVPAAVSGAVAIALVSQPLLATGDANELPEISAEELITKVLDAEPQAMSGTVVHTARLGLPDMLFTEATGADPISLLGGSSTIRLWTDGQERSRVALLGTMSEYSVVADGAEMWTYSSAEDEAVRYSLSDADLAELESMGEEARAEMLERQSALPSPQEAAEQALAMVNEYSTVEIDVQSTIAGRDVYQVIVTPTSDDTLVERVALAIDGETMTPLRVQTWSTQDASAPAVEISFTDVDFGMPSESVFDFTAPASATERDVVIPLPEKDGTDRETGEKHEMPVVMGEGWESVVEVEGMDFAALLSQDPASVTDAGGRIMGSEEAQKMLEEFVPESDGMSLEMDELFNQLTTEVPEGDLFSTALLNVLVTDDGRVLVGAISADALRALA